MTATVLCVFLVAGQWRYRQHCCTSVDPPLLSEETEDDLHEVYGAAAGYVPDCGNAVVLQGACAELLVAHRVWGVGRKPAVAVIVAHGTPAARRPQPRLGRNSPARVAVQPQPRRKLPPGAGRMAGTEPIGIPSFQSELTAYRTPDVYDA